MLRFVSFFKGEIENIKLSSCSQEKNNDVLINFDKNIKEISCSAFYDKEELDEIPCSVTQVNNEDEKRFIVSFDSGEERCKIDIGQSYYVKGDVKDKWGNFLLFFLPFVGANTNPATLKISEVRPLYSKKPKSEFIEMIVIIEMIVTKEGKLSGIKKLLNVGSKKEPDYTFLLAYVKKGILSAIDCLEDGFEDSIQYYNFSKIDSKKISSTNTLERLNKEIRRLKSCRRYLSKHRISL